MNSSSNAACGAAGGAAILRRGLRAWHRVVELVVQILDDEVNVDTTSWDGRVADLGKDGRLRTVVEGPVWTSCGSRR